MGNNHSYVTFFNELDQIYYDPNEEGSYGRIQKLISAAKAKGRMVSEKSIKDYLGRQARCTLHNPSRKNVKRNQTVVGGIYQRWQADLADMQAVSSKNKSSKYILTVNDVFSKYAWASPVKIQRWYRIEKCL